MEKKGLGRQSRKNHVGSVGLPETQLFFWPNLMERNLNFYHCHPLGPFLTKIC